MQKFQPPYLQYDSVFPQLGQMPITQASLGYRSPIMSPYCAIGPNQTSRDPVFMQWPSHAMMYTQSYDQFRHAVFQVGFCPFIHYGFIPSKMIPSNITDFTFRNLGSLRYVWCVCLVWSIVFLVQQILLAVFPTDNVIATLCTSWVFLFSRMVLVF